MLAYDKAAGLAVRSAERYQRKHCSPADSALEHAERVLKRLGHDWTFGVETVSAPTGRTLYFLNAGDTYASTIAIEVGDWGDVSEPFVTSWGDWLEGQEEEYVEDTGEIRCAYCGEWTPCEENWHETVCESCGHHVDGSN